MARTYQRAVGALLGGSVLALTVTPSAAATTSAPNAVADGNSSLMVVLDSSGSMADEDGSGSTRIESARKAVGTLVDGLPDNYPTGLRVYGSEQRKGCTDTELVQPVAPLDRVELKKAAAGVEPRGDTPTALALEKAVADLPDVPDTELGQRTVVLISDGESNCGAPDPCEVAEKLTAEHVDVHIDTVGFQVRGRAKSELECIAEKGNGSYYDAPDADALARQLERAGRLSAEGYRFDGTRIKGAASEAKGPKLTPGQYLDTIGPGEIRYYRAELDDSSATDLAATAVPQSGTEVRYGDGLRIRMYSIDDRRPACSINERANFQQNDGALPLTASVSRVPSDKANHTCDRSGEFAIRVERHSAVASDTSRWPLEMRLHTEKPLKSEVTPAASAPDYGKAIEDGLRLPSGAPKDVEGGTGFNDATKVGAGVWRDRLLPAQTRWYKVPVTWGQQLRYNVEFGNEPTRDGSGSTFVRAQTFNPNRLRIPVTSDFTPSRSYRGDPTAVAVGTVPVSWTNRYETTSRVTPVRVDGDYYIAVSLGAKAAELAENTSIGVVLRIDVLGEAKSGPAHDAPPVQGGDDDEIDGKEAAASQSGSGGDGWSSTAVAALAGGTGLALLAGLAVAYAVSSRRGAGGVRT